MKKIDGKAIAKKMKQQLREEVVSLGTHPSLAVFLVGDDEASHLYVKLKKKAAEAIGIDFQSYECEADITEEQLMNALSFINRDDSIDAVLIQVPLPEGFDQDKVIGALDPAKDVDGFHPVTMEKFLAGESDFMPGLTNGIVKLIDETKEDIKGKKACILSNSDIFALPLKKVLEERGVEVHHMTPDEDGVKDCTRQSDIVVIAIGRPEFLTGDMIKDGAILIDVGTNKVDGKVVGDIKADDMDVKEGYLTPVPGGVGPVTVAMLLENTIKLSKNR